MKKIIAIAALILNSTVYAAEHEVKMLDMDDAKNTMVFEPAILKVAVGDTVKFLPTHKSHYVESKIVPEGAEKFASELDQEFTVKLEKEGIYVYVCPPHSMMNMVGIIQVGAPVNIEDVKNKAPKMEKRANVNKGRLEALVKELDESNQK